MLGVFFVNYFNGCFNKKDCIEIYDTNKSVIKRVIDTQYVHDKKVIYKSGKRIVKDTTVYVDITFPVDTASILKEFYSVSSFSDTLKLDSGYVAVSDSIGQNKIVSRKYTASIYNKTINEKVYIKEPFKTTFFWGIGAGIGKTASEASVNMFMETKKRRLYGLGIGVINATPVIKANVLIKL